MRKRIVSLMLLFAMLITAIPVMTAGVVAEEVTAPQEGEGTADAFDYEALYVKEGLVNLFTIYGEDNGLDLSKATWTDKLKGSVATLYGTGAKSGQPTRWAQNADGSFGFNVLKGAIMEDGSYNNSGDGATNLGNDIRLQFGVAHCTVGVGKCIHLIGNHL